MRDSYTNYTHTYIYIYIENADATPPHLEVFPAVGEHSGFARFCADLCGEQLRACFHNAIIAGFCRSDFCYSSDTSKSNQISVSKLP